MKKPTMTLDDIRRAIAEQDAMLRAAYEALDPDEPVLVSRREMERLEECATPPAGAAEPFTVSVIRC